MGLLDQIRGIFGGQEEKEVKIVTNEKAEDNIAPLVAPIYREIPPEGKAGRYIQEGTRSWAYVAMGAIADEIATTDGILFRKSGKDWLPIEEHPFITLLNRPNAFQTKEEFLWLTALYLLSEGEAPWYLNSKKNPTEMVLLNPERLRIVFSSETIIGSYKYRTQAGTETTIDAEQVVFLKLPSYNTPFRGMGILRYISQTLDLDNYIEEYLRLFFFNDTTPGAILQTDGTLKKETIQRLKQQFREKHGGYKNSHKMAVLEQGLKWTKVSANLNELELRGINEWIRDKVLSAFKVPKSVAGVIDDVNRANGENADRVFAKRAVLPKLKIVEAQINQFLLPKFGDGKTLWFEFENIVLQDKLTEAQIHTAYVNAGIMTVDEVRKQIGLEPIEKADEEETPEEEMPPKEEAKAKRTRKKTDSVFTSIVKDILVEPKEPKKVYTQEEIQKYHEDKIMFSDLLEREYVGKLMANQKRQLKELRNQITEQSKSVDLKLKAKNKVSLSLDKEKEEAIMLRISDPILQEAILKEGNLASAILGLDPILTGTDELSRKFLDKHLVRLGKSTTDTTTDSINRIVEEWNAQEENSFNDLKLSLSEYLGDSKRAEVIARTEVANAAGFAQAQTYKEAGAIGKKWITARDEVCEFCQAMEEEFSDAVQDINRNFFNKGDRLVGLDGGIMTVDWESIDAPPLHPNCRCDIVPVFEESKGLEWEKAKKLHEAKVTLTLSRQEAKERLEAHEKAIRDKELRLIEKEATIAKKELLTTKNLKETEKLKEESEAELKEIKSYKEELDGKAR